MDNNDRIDIIEMLAVLWRYRTTVIVTLAVFLVAGVAVPFGINRTRATQESSVVSYQANVVLYFETLEQSLLQGGRVREIARDYHRLAGTILTSFRTPRSLTTLFPDLEISAEERTALASLEVRYDNEDPRLVTVTVGHPEETVVAQTIDRVP